MIIVAIHPSKKGRESSEWEGRGGGEGESGVEWSEGDFVRFNDKYRLSKRRKKGEREIGLRSC